MEMPLRFVILTAIVVLVLVTVIAFFITQVGTSAEQISECERNGGTCTTSCQGGNLGTFKCNSMTEDTETVYGKTTAGNVVCCFTTK
jgi:hypothetical protein